MTTGSPTIKGERVRYTAPRGSRGWRLGNIADGDGTALKTRLEPGATDVEALVEFDSGTRRWVPLGRLTLL